MGASRSNPHDVDSQRVIDHERVFHDLLLGLTRLYVLHRASQAPIFGVGMRDELAARGHQVSSGTLYPLLHNLEAADLLERGERIVGGKVRKYYEITPKGQLALDQTRTMTGELLRECMDP